MKIKKIEYENFRNFKTRGSVEFSTDGTVTLIYGTNGTGKTTFHQLFRWIIYGNVKFNKTTNDIILYNLDLESKSSINDQFSVFGKIDFESDNQEYSMRREWVYKKKENGVKRLSTEFSIVRKTSNLNWERVNNPDEFVEQILPSGLSEYFFFDGESMISDLKLKGRDSAAKLKEALYLILGLNVYDKASKVIGNETQRTSVLGMLTLSKTDKGSGLELETLGLKYQSALDVEENLKDNLKELNKQIKDKQDYINELSEKIGSAKSQKEYNEQRKQHQQHRDDYLKNVQDNYYLFGEVMIESFPKLFLSTATKRAAKVIETQKNMKKLVYGVDVPLLDALLKEEKCICGNVITEKERKELTELYKQLPPHGYASLYNNFTLVAKNWGKEYSREKVERYILGAADNMEKAQKEELAISEIDKKLKEDKKFEKYVDDRIIAESELTELIREKVPECSKSLKSAQLLVKKLFNDINVISAGMDANKTIDLKIKIMKSVKDHFDILLLEKASEYSRKLQTAIQDLIDQMLEATRTVDISSDFTLRVYDSHGDESKSEGQFATVSFAYIGGIFKVLKEEKILSNKEYPLVLDAPFSKLGKEPRQKVVDIIPNYAPQIIILSKDDLHEVFQQNQIGKVYTITSNDEQNISEIREGYLW
ncbi:MAG TPA: AAA family ATPase [Gallicola sp.]|nr:AAA family ATPase [Gallicola sp.]